MFRRTIFMACAVALTAATASTASAAGYGYSGYQQKAAPAYRAKSAYNGDNAHVRWCYNTYRSYRISDNSFQPYDGPRKACVSPHVAARLALFPEAAPAAPAGGGLRDQFGNLTEAPPQAAPAAADVDGARDEFGNLAEGAPAASGGEIPETGAAPAAPALEASPAENASAGTAQDEEAGVDAQAEGETPDGDEAPAAASGGTGEDESGADNS